MKKFLALALAVIMALTLIACGEKPAPPPAPAPDLPPHATRRTPQPRCRTVPWSR